MKASSDFDLAFCKQPIKSNRLTWNQVIAVCILIVHYDSVACGIGTQARDS